MFSWHCLPVTDPMPLRNGTGLVLVEVNIAVELTVHEQSPNP